MSGVLEERSCARTSGVRCRSSVRSPRDSIGPRIARQRAYAPFRRCERKLEVRGESRKQAPIAVCGDSCLLPPEGSGLRIVRGAAEVDVAEFVGSRVADVHRHACPVACFPYAGDADPKILVGVRRDSFGDPGRRRRLRASNRSHRIRRGAVRQDDPEQLNPNQRDEPPAAHRARLSCRSTRGQSPVPPPLTPGRRPGIYDFVAPSA